MGGASTKESTKESTTVDTSKTLDEIYTDFLDKTVYDTYLYKVNSGLDLRNFNYVSKSGGLLSSGRSSGRSSSRSSGPGSSSGKSAVEILQLYDKSDVPLKTPIPEAYLKRFNRSSYKITDVLEKRYFTRFSQEVGRAFPAPILYMLEFTLGDKKIHSDCFTIQNGDGSLVHNCIFAADGYQLCKYLTPKLLNRLPVGDRNVVASSILDTLIPSFMPADADIAEAINNQSANVQIKLVPIQCPEPFTPDKLLVREGLKFYNFGNAFTPKRINDRPDLDITVLKNGIYFQSYVKGGEETSELSETFEFPSLSIHSISLIAATIICLIVLLFIVMFTLDYFDINMYRAPMEKSGVV